MTHPRLRLAAAHHVLGMSSVSDWIDAADAALNDGVYSHSLGELWSSKLYETDHATLFLDALEELDVSVPRPETAVELLLEYHVGRLVEGGVFFGGFVDAVFAVERAVRARPDLMRTPALNTLEPFTRFYRMLDQYLAGRAWTEFLGSPDHHLPFHEMNATIAGWVEELTTQGKEWCLARWAARIDPAWWTSTVRALAAGVAAECAFDRLPILADALQDAGCEDAGVLDHLRTGGPHARYCYLADILSR